MNCTLRVVLALAVALGVAALTGCRQDSSAVADEPGVGRPFRIVTTIRPLELIVRELVDGSALAGRIEVVSIMTPEVSPHGFEPSPSQVARLKRADLVVYNGLGLDDWAGWGLPPHTRIARFEDVVDLEAEHERLHHHDHDDGVHEHGPECDHGPIDEHFWVDPGLVAEFARVIAGEIAEGFNTARSDSGQVKFEEPLQRFLGRVDEVEDRLRQMFSQHQGRRIVTHHNVFPRLAERYGLGQPIVLRPLAVLEPSAGDLRRAIEGIRAENIRAILIEPQFSPAAARRVSEETGAAMIQVDPLGAAADSWSDLMMSIAEAIAQSLRR